MKNNTIISEMKVYDYPQEDSYVTGKFESSISPLLKRLPDPKHILKMFAHVQKHKANNRKIYDAAAYNAKVDDEAYFIALDDGYKDVYNQVYAALIENDFSLFDFMESYQAFISESADNSGVEHGFIL